MTRLLVTLVAAIVALAPPIALRARTDMSANMIGAWELEADGTDSIGTNTLTVNNAPSFVAAKQGNGVDLELGSTQYLSIADNAALSLSTDTNLTMAAWVRMESNATNMQPVSKNGEYEIRFTSGALQIAVTDASPFTSVVSSGAASTNTYYHVCGGHDAAANQTWIRRNGGSTNTTAANANGTRDTTGEFNIGATVGTNHFDGILDQVIVWKAKRSDADCDEIYNAGSGVTLASITGGGGGGGATLCRGALLGVGCEARNQIRSYRRFHEWSRYRDPLR